MQKEIFDAFQKLAFSNDVHHLITDQYFTIIKITVSHIHSSSPSTFFPCIFLLEKFTLVYYKEVPHRLFFYLQILPSTKSKRTLSVQTTKIIKLLEKKFLSILLWKILKFALKAYDSIQSKL